MLEKLKLQIYAGFHSSHFSKKILINQTKQLILMQCNHTAEKDSGIPKGVPNKLVSQRTKCESLVKSILFMQPKISEDIKNCGIKLELYNHNQTQIQPRPQSAGNQPGGRYCRLITVDYLNTLQGHIKH